MKKVAKNSAVLEVVNIPNVQKQLDRLSELLNKIQKALGEYLERERASFPRSAVITPSCITFHLLLLVQLCALIC